MLPQLRKLQLVDEYVLKLYVKRSKSENQLDVKKKIFIATCWYLHFPYRRPSRIALQGSHWIHFGNKDADLIL
jgi:hypothetical protein